jgi:hypothetical protein
LALKIGGHWSVKNISGRLESNIVSWN